MIIYTVSVCVAGQCVDVDVLADDEAEAQNIALVQVRQMCVVESVESYGDE